jgi:hypothetical protein
MDEKDIDVSVSNEVLTIKGEKKSGKRGEKTQLLPHGAFLWNLPEVYSSSHRSGERQGSSQLQKGRFKHHSS